MYRIICDKKDILVQLESPKYTNKCDVCLLNKECELRENIKVENLAIEESILYILLSTSDIIKVLSSNNRVFVSARDSIVKAVEVLKNNFNDVKSSITIDPKYSKYIENLIQRINDITRR